MLNIEKYKDEILKEYRDSFESPYNFNGDGNRMNKAIKNVAFKKCGERLPGARKTLIWLASEYKEPILDDVEKQYLSAVIKPFKDRVTVIVKTSVSDCERIIIQCTTPISDAVHISSIILPPFKKGKMYKKMEIDRNYTLEELGL